ncbi:MAG: NADH-quinone oxidoreductase subunit H [Deltaproteobacteria bacterium]|nr:MAG: NADH-quinone oxidoreductase subunit H [Deltaproteobacteria bacterium]
MTWAELSLTFIKIVIVVVFLLIMAALSVWADRRQGALIQDRVGPMRAVVYLHHAIVRALIAAPAFLIAGAISIPFWHQSPGVEQARITTGLEIAVLVGWFSLLLLSSHVRRRGSDNGFEAMVAQADPRAYFYGGLVLHVAVLPLARLVPTSWYAAGGIQWGPGLSGAIAAMVIMFCGLYASSKVPDGKVGIRIAGLFQPVADAIKMIWKEELRPDNADRFLYALAPFLGLFPVLITIAVVPFGSTVCFRDANHDGGLGFGELFGLQNIVEQSGQCAAGHLPVHLQVVDLNVGLLYIFAIAGTGVIGAAIAGWASDNKFALLGGLRATSQMVSYEVALGLSIVPILMIVGSVDVRTLVDWQGNNAWGIFAQPAAFVLFSVAAIAETKRIPFDLPEGESEIVAGYLLEYSAMRFGLFFLGEYAEFGFSAVLLVTLFLGGYHVPFLYGDGIHVAFGSTAVFDLTMSHLAVTVIHIMAFFGKVLFLTFLMVFIRWTLPRFRYDQLMSLGWKKLLPLALANILLTGIVILMIDGGGEGAASALKLIADITQALIALGGLVALVAAVTWLLEPAHRKRLVHSSAARYAAAVGDVKASDLQA